MRLGAHVSASGGLDKGIERAQDMGAETVQMFASSPRAWAFKSPSQKQVQGFREKSTAFGISPVFFHGSYLVNLCGTASLVEKSVSSLRNHMNVAGQVGAVGVIFHGGSHKGVGFNGVLKQFVDAAQSVLSSTPEEVMLIVENSAGMGDHIGSSFAEIGILIDSIGSPRVTVCLDTQHTIAAGYDLSDSDGVGALMEEFDRKVGLSKLVAVHANDSKTGLGSGVDRHENIGEGYIGIEGFKNLMSHSAFREVPFILEVPGFQKMGPDKENLDLLKAVRAELGFPT